MVGLEIRLADRFRKLDGTNLVLMVAAALVFLSFCYTEIAGADLWWRVASGRELVQAKALWLVDDWSFASGGGEWLSHEWLADLIFYAWVSAWGIESLIYFKWLLVVTSFAILVYVLDRETRSPLTALLCSTLAIAGAAPYLDVGPQLYTLLNFSLLLFLLLGRQASPWLPALLFIGWVNLHSGFIVGLLALAILVWPWRGRSTPQRPNRALWTLSICLLACLFNPLGVDAFPYALNQVLGFDQSAALLEEWLVANEAGRAGSQISAYLVWLPAVGIVYFLPAVRRVLEVPRAGILLTGLCFVTALLSPLYVPLLGMSLAVMVAPAAVYFLRWLRLERFSAGFGWALLLYGLFHLPPHPLKSGPALRYLSAEYLYPVEMLNFIEANGLRGNVYAPYSWGGYIHWRTDGELKVFLDSRTGGLYDADSYRQYLSVLASRPGWLALVEDSDADYILWPHEFGDGRGKLQQLLDSGRWQPVCDDAVSWLLARAPTWLAGSAQPRPETPWCDIAVAGNRYPERPAGDKVGSLEWGADRDAGTR